MISPEQRKQKPCALPVQCIPCTSLKEREIRQLASELAATLFLHRYVKGICGFTRETLIAVTTNIESRECRRWDSFNAGLAPEHPRASTSDDCECFFSVMRDNIGKHFTLKEVKFNFRKVCLEFGKRIDPNLPYFYHTSSHHRFSEGSLPDFDQPRTSKRKSRFSRVPQREQPAAFVPGRATLPGEDPSLSGANFITNTLTYHHHHLLHQCMCGNTLMHSIRDTLLYH